jgi:hypothetical protein
MEWRWPLRGLMERVFRKADAINLPDYPGLSLAQPNSEVALPRDHSSRCVCPGFERDLADASGWILPKRTTGDASRRCGWGIALFPSAADDHWPHLCCVGTWMPNDESLLNVWFRRCSAVVDSSNVSKFA